MTETILSRLGGAVAFSRGILWKFLSGSCRANDRGAEGLVEKLMPSRNPALKSLILVGGVKSKHNHTSAAQDLYNSRLWRCRRAYAERSGFPWYILSAKHGLLAPETKIAPYDLALADLPAAERRAWSRRVLDDLPCGSSNRIQKSSIRPA